MESPHTSFVQRLTWLYSTACPCLTPVSMNEGQLATYMHSSDSITAPATTTQLQMLNSSFTPSHVVTVLAVSQYKTTYRHTSLYTNEMSSAGYPMPPRQLLQLFADGLPNNATFSNLRQSTYISLDEPDDLRLPTMEDTYARARIIDDTSQRLRLRRTDTKARQPNLPTTMAALYRAEGEAYMRKLWGCPSDEELLPSWGCYGRETG
jgi:hypothetical protein